MHHLMGKSQSALFDDRIKMETKDLNWDLIIELNEAANTAYGAEHYIESAAIYFQLVEVCLRVTISYMGLKAGFDSSKTEKLMREDDRFSRLVEYFHFFHANENFYKRLKEFNRKRNKIFHDLFLRFESREALTKELKEFIEEARELFIGLGKICGVEKR
ncbi:MAG: hypothetical protein AB1502_06275 [Thermodesulfobacteriota bacterium]